MLDCDSTGLPSNILKIQMVSFSSLDSDTLLYTLDLATFVISCWIEYKGVFFYYFVLLFRE